MNDISEISELLPNQAGNNHVLSNCFFLFIWAINKIVDILKKNCLLIQWTDHWNLNMGWSQND